VTALIWYFKHLAFMPLLSLFLVLGDPLRSAEDPEKEDPFTQKEAHRIIARFKDHYPEWYEFAMTLHRTGMRIGEVMALRWRDVDFEKFRFTSGVIFLQASTNQSKGIQRPSGVRVARWICPLSWQKR